MACIDLIVIPYDSGRRGMRMGAGPIAFMNAGLEGTLRNAGHDTSVTWIESAASDPLASAVEHATQVATITRAARARGRIPVVLAGNCISTVGAFAGVRGERTGLAWLDAHADLNTPETSPSGFLDGMAAATILGWCHAAAFERGADHQPWPSRNLLLIGGRSFDPAEAKQIAAGHVALVSPASARDHVQRNALLDSFATGIDDVYVHLDLDVLDPEACGPANSFATADGLTDSDTAEVIGRLSANAALVGITIAAYDPAIDTNGAVRMAALRLIDKVLNPSMKSTHD
jgi:arginase